jgi:hypothetical protein
MAPTILSPNTGNYLIGKGAFWFHRSGGTNLHMGNSPGAEFTPTIEKLDHFSSMEGVREKDLSVVLERGGTLTITLDEWTPNNVSLAVLGTVDEGAAGGPEVEIFDQDAINGELTFIAANDVGPQWDYTWFNVSFIPSQAINPISDEWGQIEIEGEVLVSQTEPNVGRFGFMKLKNLAS